MPKPKRNIHAVAEETLTPPDTLPEGQKIARVKNAAGNNLYNLELPGASPTEAFLAELPSKFRFTIWIKRGNYVVVDTTALADRGNKLGGEIVNIVRDEKRWRKMQYWPKEFEKTRAEAYGGESDEEEDDGPKMPPSDDDEDED